MALDLLLVREGNRLAPADSLSADTMLDIANGEYVTAVIRRPRNLKHLRKFWALINVVFKAQSYFATKKAFVNEIKMATGHFESGVTRDGIPYVEIASISFAALDQKSFTEFYDKAVEVILTRILPNVNRFDLEAQVMEIIEGVNPR